MPNKQEQVALFRFLSAFSYYNEDGREWPLHEALSKLNTDTFSQVAKDAEQLYSIIYEIEQQRGYYSHLQEGEE